MSEAGIALSVKLSQQVTKFCQWIEAQAATLEDPMS